MDFAQNYKQSSVPFAKPTAFNILNEFSSYYNWENIVDSEERTALDIGFGDGSVMVEVIKPFLPASTRLDGADKSEDMIRFAKHCYEEKGYKFFSLNIEDEMLDKNILESYNHVFSFLCFHFIEKPSQALRNIYDILKPNGNLLMYFLPNLPFYNAMKTVSLNPKWSSYMEDIDAICFQPFARYEFPDKVLADLMSECGFKNIITSVDTKSALFDSWQTLEGLAQYLDPFGERMPLKLRNEYFKAYFEAIRQIDGLWVEKYNENGEFVGVLESCEVLIGYCEKVF